MLTTSELQQQADISCMLTFFGSARSLSLTSDVDFLSPITYWPLIEASLQIVAACLTMLRPLAQDWRLIFRSKGKLSNSGYLRSDESRESNDGRIFVDRYVSQSSHDEGDLTCVTDNIRFESISSIRLRWMRCHCTRPGCLNEENLSNISRLRR